MTLFESLVLAHLVGDYLLQTDAEANQKMHGSILNLPLWKHVAKYTASCAVPLWYFGISFWFLIPIFVTHLFFDRRWPIIWWRRHVMRNSEESITKMFWLTIMVDQIFHVIVLGLIVLLATKFI